MLWNYLLVDLIFLMIINDDLKNYVDNVTRQNRRMGTKTIVELLKNDDQLPNASYGTINTIRHSLGYNYLPPIDTFDLTEEQRVNRLKFANFHLQNHTNWSNVLFVDESAFYLDNSHRWVWRRRGEFDEKLVQHRKNKYTPKVMIFGGISLNWKSPLISIQGNIDSKVYIDDCIDGAEIFPNMNCIYGNHQWYLAQDGAKVHTSFETMDYLQSYCNVLPNWPSNSPDLNPIENCWAIVKRRVEDLQPQSIDDLIQTTFDTWENIPNNIIQNLISSVPNRLTACVNANGMQTGY